MKKFNLILMLQAIYEDPSNHTCHVNPTKLSE